LRKDNSPGLADNGDKELQLLKGLVKILVEMLPRHASDCYGLQVHPSNRAEYCDCDMKMARDEIRGTEL
jgi:hypothetical protein